ncbi:hypothetical protein PR048_024688 [Dryococelus australis]|uniref:Ig-like domain-containing protein n=1 Tax=Dryococelus australis TaxID=614101 RepID=A0ABQ9GP86_9NEOP|nr:hypothetical protein PR048_024688 [Dryococelus australis]
MSAYMRKKAKSKYRNSIRLERATQKHSSDTHRTPYDRVKLCRNTPGCSHVGIVPDDAVGRRVFSGSPVSPAFHSGAAPSSPQSPLSTLKTPMLRAIQIASLLLTGAPSASFKELIFVPDPPIVSLRLGDTLNPDDIKEGDDVYFECHVKANPPWRKLSWMHNKKEPQMVVRSTHEGDNSPQFSVPPQLTSAWRISRARASCEGHVTCTVQRDGNAASQFSFFLVYGRSDAMRACQCRPYRFLSYGSLKVQNASGIGGREIRGIQLGYRGERERRGWPVWKSLKRPGRMSCHRQAHGRGRKTLCCGLSDDAVRRVQVFCPVCFSATLCKEMRSWLRATFPRLPAPHVMCWLNHTRRRRPAESAELFCAGDSGDVCTKMSMYPGEAEHIDDVTHSIPIHD